MSTVPRRAGGTTFFRHVHLKAGIEVPRARFLYMNEERCARARPPGRTRARRPARRVCRAVMAMRFACMHSRTEMTASGRKGILRRVRVCAVKNPFSSQSQDNFLEPARADLLRRRVR